MRKLSEIMADTDELLKLIGSDTKPAKKPQGEIKNEKRDIESGKGYVYVYNEKGKPVPKARFLMEKRLNRKLEDHEIVMFRDGNRKNFDLSNLAVGFKAGVDYQQMECKHCGMRAGWLINDKSEV